MNEFLFKLTGWGLLALAWAWLSLEWLPSYADRGQFEAVAAALGGGDLPTPRPEVHPIVKLAAETPAYTFFAGILAVAWIYLLMKKKGSYYGSAVSEVAP